MKGFQLFAISALFALAAVGSTHAEGVSPDKITLPGPFGPPSWDTQYPAKERFLVLTQFSSNAVLDRETGLVWERSPVSGTLDWPAAMHSCHSVIIGNRKGWRLPSYEEMTSLLDPTHSNPALPANNPFKNFLPTDFFWTSTTYEAETTFAYAVNIADATQNSLLSKITSPPTRRWCVRGGQAAANPMN